MPRCMALVCGFCDAAASIPAPTTQLASAPANKGRKRVMKTYYNDAGEEVTGAVWGGGGGKGAREQRLLTADLAASAGYGLGFSIPNTCALQKWWTRTGRRRPRALRRRRLRSSNPRRRARPHSPSLRRGKSSPRRPSAASPAAGSSATSCRFSVPSSEDCSPCRGSCMAVGQVAPPAVQGPATKDSRTGGWLRGFTVLCVHTHLPPETPSVGHKAIAGTPAAML